MQNAGPVRINETWTVAGGTLTLGAVDHVPVHDFAHCRACLLLGVTAAGEIEPQHVRQEQQLLMRQGFEALRRREADRRLAQRNQARDRAKELLRACLTEEQRSDMDRYGRFEVVGSNGGRYQLNISSYSGNIYSVDAHGGFGGCLCAHGRDDLPLADHLLLQKLAIESDEAKFLATALDY